MVGCASTDLVLPIARELPGLLPPLRLTRRQVQLSCFPLVQKQTLLAQVPYLLVMLTPKRGLNTSRYHFVGSSFRPVVEKSKAEACTEFDADAGGMADAVVIEDKPMNIATATVVMRAMFFSATQSFKYAHRASL